MRAIKLNEPLAQSQGINPLAYKLLAIGLSALLAGMVGGLFVFYLTIVDPSVFDFYYTETMLIMVIIGGPGSFWGVLCSTAVLAGVARPAALHHRSAHGALRRGADRRHAARSPAASAAGWSAGAWPAGAARAAASS